MTEDAIFRVQIDSRVKAEAARVLDGMGLSMSDAVRLLLVRVASDQALPFEIPPETREPSAETREAIAELESGEGVRFATVADLMADLNADH